VLCAMIACVWAAGPNVLVVQAHPDDETMFAGALYKIAHDLGGVVRGGVWMEGRFGSLMQVDDVVITDGEGGYSCSEIAEWIYHEKVRS
jgi:N-acetylglucosamine malate deacetylase 2